MRVRRLLRSGYGGTSCRAMAHGSSGRTAGDHNVGPGIFAPAYEIWLAAVRRVRPDLYSAFNPWDRITTPGAVRKLFADAGVSRVDVVPEEGHQALRAPEDFWMIALGSGLRWTIDQMGANVAHEVKQAILGALAAKRIERVGANVIYAVAQRQEAA